MSAHSSQAELFRDTSVLSIARVHPTTSGGTNNPNSSSTHLDSNEQPGVMARATTYAMDANSEAALDFAHDRYPHSIVWTPIPCITWFCPCVGHMGIAYTNGVIRDFAGSYFVSEDNMAFGRPTRYLQLPLDRVTVAQPVTTNPAVQQELSPTRSRAEQWDRGVYDASVEYKQHVHNLCCDNCHSHVALALNNMRYESSSDWNMFKLAALITFRGRHVGVGGFLRTWLPFLILFAITICAIIFLGFAV